MRWGASVSRAFQSLNPRSMAAIAGAHSTIRPALSSACAREPWSKTSSAVASPGAPGAVPSARRSSSMSDRASRSPSKRSSAWDGVAGSDEAREPDQQGLTAGSRGRVVSRRRSGAA